MANISEGDWGRVEDVQILSVLKPKSKFMNTEHTKHEEENVTQLAVIFKIFINLSFCS